MIWTRVLLALVCWTLLPHLATYAQDVSTPAEPPVQSVAHGVMAMPAETMVWQSELQRAVVSPRAVAARQPGGFVVADTGAMVITDANGKPLHRLAPGNAAWIEPGATRAIVSLEGRSAGYLRVSLIPASFVPDDPGAASHGEPFAAPPGVADLELLRDILERGEELAISSGAAPALLQVTSGKIFVTYESGEIAEVAAGTPVQFQGQVTVAGASRSPAALVIARLGSPLPARVALHDPAATPLATPLATPVGTPLAQDDATLAVSAWLCPPGYDTSAPLVSCTVPAVGLRFTADAADETTHLLTDATGQATFADLPAGPLRLTAHLPDRAATAVASCRNHRGDATGRVRNDVIPVFLASGARITCAWFVEPGEVWPAASLTVTVLTCPPGMSVAALQPELCQLAPVEITMRLGIDGAVLEPVMLADGVWAWEPLLENSYSLTVADLPSGVEAVVLDDGGVAGRGESIEVILDDAPALMRTLYLLQPTAENAADIDSDADGLTDAQELEIGTDPYLADSDGDGLVDGDETGFYGTDPLAADTDEDGLDDQEEVALFFTNPFLVDTDGDGVGDAEEVAAQTNPLDMLSLPPTPTPAATMTPTPAPLPTATVSPSPTVRATTTAATPYVVPVATATHSPAALPTLAPDATPISHLLTAPGTPVSVSAADALDNDGLATLDEIAIHGTDPLRPDTDGDGMNDGDEVASGRDPLDPAN